MFLMNGGVGATAGGEVVLSLQGADTDTKTHQHYSTVTLLQRKPCCCTLRAPRCTNITQSFIHSLFNREKKTIYRGYFGLASLLNAESVVIWYIF